MFVLWLKFMFVVIVVFLLSLFFIKEATLFLAATIRMSGERRNELLRQQEREKREAESAKTWESVLSSSAEHRTVYIEICQENRELRMPHEESTITSATERIRENTRKICKISRAGDFSSLVLCSLRMQRNRLLRILGQEFDKIVNMPGLNDVSINYSSLVVTTEPIELSHGADSRQLGRFEIRIGTNHSIALVPIDVRPEDKEVVHPNVRGDAILMNPKLKASIAKLLAEHRFSDVVSILMDFLKTYDPRLAFTPL